MNKKFSLIIFTDLDGSLLHRDNFKFDKIKDYVKNLIDEGITIQQLTVDFDLCKSLGESKRLISQGGISINGNKILDPEKNITYGDLKADKVIIISKGKKTHKIITVD